MGLLQADGVGSPHTLATGKRRELSQCREQPLCDPHLPPAGHHGSPEGSQSGRQEAGHLSSRVIASRQEGLCPIERDYGVSPQPQPSGRLGPSEASGDGPHLGTVT